MIPAPIRAELGIRPGDVVHFVATEDGDYRLATTSTLVDQMWANNQGGDAFDAAEEVRASRRKDRRNESAAEDRLAERLPEPKSTEALLTDLGLDS